MKISKKNSMEYFNFFFFWACGIWKPSQNGIVILLSYTSINIMFSNAKKLVYTYKCPQWQWYSLVHTVQYATSVSIVLPLKLP